MATESLLFSIGADTKAFQNQMAGCMKQLVSLGAAFAAVHEVVDGFGKALDLGGRLTDLSGRTGELAGNLYVLEHAFGKNGIAAEKVGTSLNKLQKFVGDAVGGSAEATKTLAELGLTVSDLAGKLPIEQMGVIAERIAQIQDPSQRASAAMAVFGKSGGELLPILRNFSEEMRIAKNETGSMAKVLNDSAGELDAMGEKLEGFGKARTHFYTGFAAQVAGAFNESSRAFEEMTGQMRIDWAGVGDFIGDTFAHGSIWGGMRQWQKHFGESVTTAHEIAAALEPLTQIGQEFSTNMTSVADRLDIALGKSSLIDVLTRKPEKPWGSGGGGMLGIENHDPNALVDFSDANDRAKARAAHDRWRRVRGMKDQEYANGLAGTMAMIGDAFSGLPGFLPPGFGNQQLFGPRVTRQPRASKITGAQFDNRRVDSTNLTPNDIMDAINPGQKGFEDVLGSKKGTSPGKGQREKQKAEGEAARAGTQDPLAGMARDLAIVREKIVLIEPKLPQRVGTA